MSFSSHQKLFVCIMDRVLFSEQHSMLVFGNNLCANGHDLNRHIVIRMFNSFAKNYVKDVSNAAEEEKKQKRDRKAAKLSGKSNL